MVRPPPFEIDQRVFGRDSASGNFYPSVVRKARLERRGNTNSGGGGGGGGDDNDYDDRGDGASECYWTFLVHYLGWNSRFDRWTKEEDILPYTDENEEMYRRQQRKEEEEKRTTVRTEKRKKQQQQQKRRATVATATSSSATTAHRTSGGVRTKRATSSSPAAAGGGDDDDDDDRRKKKKSSSTSSQQQEKILQYYQEHVEMPVTLRTVLVDEREKLGGGGSGWGWNSPNGYDPEDVERVRAAGNGDDGVVPPPLPPPPQHPARVVHDLPAKVTIRQVLKHFRKTRLESIRAQRQHQQDEATTGVGSNGTAAATTTPEQLEEFCNGLAELFQEALPTCLLYPQERPQYELLLKKQLKHQQRLQQQQQQSTISSETGGGGGGDGGGENAGTNNNKKKQQKKNNTMWVDVYGCEFLLRLLVRLPLLMQRQHASTAAVHHHRWVGPLLADLIVVLQKNRQAIFKGNFRPPKPEEWLEWEKLAYDSGRRRHRVGEAATAGGGDYDVATTPPRIKRSEPRGDGGDGDDRMDATPMTTSPPGDRMDIRT